MKFIKKSDVVGEEVEGGGEVPRDLIIKLSYKWLVVILVLVIAGMLVIWKPWQKVSTERKIHVNGEITLRAEPDEFIFSPSYQRTTDSSKSSLNELKTLQKTITDKLKELGVSDKDIKASTNSYDNPVYKESTPTGVTQTITTLTLTVVVKSKATADKIQDYLLTTSPTGQISPTAQFSDAKRKSLEKEARIKATDDAKDKAKLQAKQLNVQLGKVIEISDGSGFDRIRPMAANTDLALTSTGSGVQPGENDYTFTVSVTYALK